MLGKVRLDKVRLDKVTNHGIKKAVSPPQTVWLSGVDVINNIFRYLAIILDSFVSQIERVTT